MLKNDIRRIWNNGSDAPLEPSYEGAKDMVLIEDIDNREFLAELFEAMYEELPEPKKKKRR